VNASKKIRVLAALGTLSGAVWAGTFATFTDSGTSASTFSTGTVDLELNNEVDDAYAFAALSTANMKPGDTKYAALTVENAGTLGYSYTMTSAETETTLSAELKLGAVIGAVTCDAAGYTTAVAVPTNIVIANGNLSAAAISTARTLAAAASEILCVRVELPSTAGDTFQGLTTTSTFTFSATQS
jgi:hypothetical protein